MATTRRKAPFWKRQTNKVITYQVTGKTKDNVYKIIESSRNREKTVIPTVSFSSKDPKTTAREKENPKKNLFKNQIISSRTQINQKKKFNEYGSPLKREVAEEMVNVLGILGNKDFVPDDFETQDNLINKLDYVQKSIKKLRGSLTKKTFYRSKETLKLESRNNYSRGSSKKIKKQVQSLRLDVKSQKTDSLGSKKNSIEHLRRNLGLDKDRFTTGSKETLIELNDCNNDPKKIKFLYDENSRLKEKIENYKSQFSQQQKLMENTIQESREQNNMLREQINERKARILEGEATEEQINTELIKMKMEEQRAMKEIAELRDNLRSLQDSRIGSKKYFQIETQALLNLNEILREKEIGFKKVREKFEDENEIKNVLMLRIKDLEDQSKTKEDESTNVCSNLENVKISQNRLNEKIEEAELKLKAFDDSTRRIDEMRRNSMKKTMERESKFKTELITEAQEKQHLSQELKRLAYKVKGMQDCLSDKNSQIENIDEKIAELVSMRRKMCGKICNLSQRRTERTFTS